MVIMSRILFKCRYNDIMNFANILKVLLKTSTYDGWVSCGTRMQMNEFHDIASIIEYITRPNQPLVQIMTIPYMHSNDFIQCLQTSIVRFGVDDCFAVNITVIDCMYSCVEAALHVSAKTPTRKIMIILNSDHASIKQINTILDTYNNAYTFVFAYDPHNPPAATGSMDACFPTKTLHHVMTKYTQTPTLKWYPPLLNDLQSKMHEHIRLIHTNPPAINIRYGKLNKSDKMLLMNGNAMLLTDDMSMVYLT